MANLAVKLCMLGGPGVGKSCLAVRFVEGYFDSKSSSTLGAAYLHKLVAIENGNIYSLQIWDTAGQERFDTIAGMYYRGATVIIVVFDVNNQVSFAHATKKWMQELKKNRDVKDILLVLVGNKVDKDEKLRQVTKIEAEECAKSLGAIYWETSAKTGFNVEKMFKAICSNIDKNEHIKAKLAPRIPTKQKLTVRSHSGKHIEVSQRKLNCCT